MTPDLDAVPRRTLVLAAAAAAIVIGLLTVSLGWFTNVGLLLVTVAAIVAVATLAQWLVQAQRPLIWDTHSNAPDERRGADSRVVTLRHNIELATSGQAPAAREVHGVVATVAEARLRERLGPDERAADALGADLAAYLDHPPTGRLSADQLNRHVQKLEELS